MAVDGEDLPQMRDADSVLWAIPAKHPVESRPCSTQKLKCSTRGLTRFLGGAVKPVLNTEQTLQVLPENRFLLMLGQAIHDRLGVS